ncbi:BNR repeat-containing protein [Thiorhodococcus fuscus]|uniref:BNR repeat-containing protein n=1 Tax=Thiorhodococcus fuscus TaxID=527200 RepID=A0ABW4YE69_9GAMM
MQRLPYQQNLDSVAGVLDKAEALARRGHTDQALDVAIEAFADRANRQALVRQLMRGYYPTFSRATALSTRKQANTMIATLRRSLIISTGQGNHSGRRFAPWVHTSTGQSQPKPRFTVQVYARRSLGNAWAGNTINTVIFRHHGILTDGKTQYTAFYVDTHTLRLVQRDLATDSLTTHDLRGEYNLRDAHNSVSLGQDRQGHLHISYDHHATQLRYRRSIKPGDITAWSDELPMTGSHEEKVTYPTFILPHHEFPLTFLYRDGRHNKGTARLKTYDEATEIWANHPQAILSGAEQKPWTSNAYWNHPAVGADGLLHLSFVWRTHPLGEEQRINNINIGYACSHDNGLTWQTSHRRPYRLPITQVNAETIHPVSPGSNLINQTSMALDSHNWSHIVFYADDPVGVPQYQHLWFDGRVWHHQFVSKRTQGFSLQGGGTLQIPISRPEIVIDRHDNAYIITRGDHTQNRLAATLLPAPNYIYQPHNIQILADEDIGFAEPIIDRERWQKENMLTLLVQYNEQPNHDTGHRAVQYPISLIDIQLNPEQ